MKIGIIRQLKSPSLFSLNPYHPFYQEIIKLIEKEAEMNPQAIKKFYPLVPGKRKIDLKTILAMASSSKLSKKIPKLSEALRKKYA